MFNFSKGHQPVRISSSDNRTTIMRSFLQIVGASLLFTVSTALPSPEGLSKRASWPYGPLTTRGRDIINSVGDVVNYAGVNWPGGADTALPEGLQYQSINTIVSKIKSLGMNVVRLTFATEMIGAPPSPYRSLVFLLMFPIQMTFSPTTRTQPYKTH